jgi:hypothetical protein
MQKLSRPRCGNFARYGPSGIPSLTGQGALRGSCRSTWHICLTKRASRLLRYQEFNATGLLSRRAESIPSPKSRTLLRIKSSLRSNYDRDNSNEQGENDNQTKRTRYINHTIQRERRKTSMAPYFPLGTDGYSNDKEATATCFCGAVQLAFVRFIPECLTSPIDLHRPLTVSSIRLPVTALTAIN